MEKYRLNSNEGEKIFINQIKINNTNIEPEVVADMIIDNLKLKQNNWRRLFF